MSLARRWTTNAGWLALLALLSLAAALLITASPRMANRYADEGLRETITSLPVLARDLSYQVRMRDPAAAARAPAGAAPRPNEAPRWAEVALSELPPPLRERVSDYWYSVQVQGVAMGDGARRIIADNNITGLELKLREQSGARQAVRLVDGVWPDNPSVISNRVAVAVSTGVASTFGMRVGDTVEIAGPAGEVTTAGGGAEDADSTVPVVVVGVFEPIDRGAPIWGEDAEAFEPYAPTGIDGVVWRGTLLTDNEGVAFAANRLPGYDLNVRFRFDETTIAVPDVPVVIGALLDARTQAPDVVTPVTTLDSALSRFADVLRSAAALLAVVQAGIGVTLFGLVVLAALAMTGRRHGELALLRSRGASLPRIGGRLLVESAPVVVIAVALGYGLSRYVPGRPGGATWLAVAFAVAAMLVAPVIAMVGLGWAERRRGSGGGLLAATGSRADLSRPRVSPRRITAELTLVTVAVLGVFLLRRRGLSAGFQSDAPAGSEVDPYLVVLPVLLAGAAAVLALRLLPYPLRLLAAAAARMRGAVAFLGLARAGRAAPASVGPVAVLVVAVSVGTFCAAVAGTVATARDQVAERTVPGDAIVQGGRFPPETAAELASVPGVQAVAPMTISLNQLVGGGNLSRALIATTAVVVDADALAEVLRASGRAETVPEVLLDQPVGQAPPAVVSADVAEALGDPDAVGTISVQGRSLAFTVGGVADSFPGLRDFRRFVVIPRSALATRDVEAIHPNTFVLAGSGFDVETVRAIGDTAQREWIANVVGGSGDGGLTEPTVVLTYAQVRADLERGGVDQVLDYTFAMGLAAGLLLALLAVGFAVATGARARGQALSRLRTMGLALRQGRWLLALELSPLILLGAVVGSAVGAALPVLLGPALGLDAFSDGGEVRFAIDPRLAGLAFGLVVLAVLVAMAVEASMNRRARLGVVLRVGEGS